PTPAARTAELPTDDPFAEAKAGCKAGQRQACLDLADAFSGGPTADPGQALVFLGRACDLRATAACEKAGLQLTAAGRDEKRARRYLERACDAGRGRACATLAVLWREGRGGDANPRTADAFERRACQLGYGASCR
ncbi:MAG: sel1 repeat family protein, partial [Myxococcales bacterium]|nr:sel1 repeat family protein [Myxococcales bacterium]